MGRYSMLTYDSDRKEKKGKKETATNLQNEKFIKRNEYKSTNKIQILHT